MHLFPPWIDMPARELGMLLTSVSRYLGSAGRPISGGGGARRACWGPSEEAARHGEGGADEGGVAVDHLAQDLGGDDLLGREPVDVKSVLLRLAVALHRDDERERDRVLA